MNWVNSRDSLAFETRDIEWWGVEQIFLKGLDIDLLAACVMSYIWWRKALIFWLNVIICDLVNGLWQDWLKDTQVLVLSEKVKEPSKFQLNPPYGLVLFGQQNASLS